MVFTNRAFEQLFGYGPDDIPTVDAWATLTYPDVADRGVFFDWWRATVEEIGDGSNSVQKKLFRVQSKDGAARSVLMIVAIVEDLLVVSFTDATPQVQAHSEVTSLEAELRSADSELEKTAYAITEAIPVGTYTMVLEPGAELARFSFMSQRFLDLCGLDREVALSDPMKAFACVHPEDFDAWVQLNAEVFANKQPFFGQTRVVVKGAVRWITAESIPRDMPDGTTVWEGVLIDVTDRVLAEQSLAKSRDEAQAAAHALAAANLELKRLATTDPLTRTHNRRAFENAVAMEVARSNRYAPRFSLLLLDIDHFKAINDQHGHLAGDGVLVKLSRCVRDELRTIDVLARWGGEEFAVLLPNTDIGQGAQVAEKLRLLIQSRIFPGVGQVTASFGVAEFQTGETISQLFRRADQALYAAKAAGRNQVSVKTAEK